MGHTKFFELEVDNNELIRTQEEFQQFLNKYSKNHFEIKMIVNGYKIFSDTGEEINLDSYSIVKIFEYKADRKLEEAHKKIEILESILAYVFDNPKNHSIRFSAGNGTLLPINRKYENPSYAINIMIGNIDIKKDWISKKEKYLKFSDYFLNHEKEALPILWYGKGLTSNDSVSAFLDFYRCIEVLSKTNLLKIKSEIRQIIDKPLNINDKSSEIKKIYDMFDIPRYLMIPLFLEEHGVQKQTYIKWKDFRNDLTHGHLSLELNDEFRHELSNLQKCAKTLLDKEINQLVQ